jgi:hypothetical protein
VILALALRRRVDRWMLIGGGAALFLLVLMRQSHIWAAALLWTAAWLGPTRRRPDLGPNPLTDIPARIGPAAASFLATLPAFVLLGAFAAAWGGNLAPPVFRDMYRLDDLGTYEAPLFFLAVFGMLSAPLISMVASTVVDLWAWRRWALFAAPLGAMAAALLVNTKFSVPGGRFSGIWNITREVDCLLGLGELSVRTSPSMVLAMGFGGLMLLIWLAAVSVRDRWIFGAGISAFVAAQCTSYFVWQRYHEPLVLILLVLMASRLPIDEQRIGLRARKTPLIGPALLTLLLLSLTIQQIATESPAKARPREVLFAPPPERDARPPDCD